jgi:NADH-quinone oxidoreductase subunit M
MPIFSMLFLIVTLSSIGLPGLNGFVGEFLVLLGSFKQGLGAFQSSHSVAPLAIPVLATTGVILSAVYMLWLYQRVIFGKVTNPKNFHLKDLSLREMLVMAPLILGIFWIGISPNHLLLRVDGTVHEFVAKASGQRSSSQTQYVPRARTNLAEMAPFSGGSK